MKDVVNFLLVIILFDHFFAYVKLSIILNSVKKILFHLFALYSMQCRIVSIDDQSLYNVFSSTISKSTIYLIVMLYSK